MWAILSPNPSTNLGGTRRNYLKNFKNTFFLTAATVSALFACATPAFAATTNNIVVKHNAYLISAPHRYAHHITLEDAGSTLTLVLGSTRYYWHVQDNNGNDGYITRGRYWTALSNGTSSNTNSSYNAQQFTSATTSSTVAYNLNNASYQTSTQLPPGVTFDPNVNAVAPLNADYQTKFDAVLLVAQSKLGTGYVWGHNEDRGQYGFDCSNFTAYVYHHALGYKMSGSSQTQYHSVGWSVPISSMRPGDLLVFNQGGHVGIYIGNGQMIQCGGGLKKVGYLKVSPGSYWYNHISAVKRMF